MSELLYKPKETKMKIMGFSSGSGNSLWKALELQKQLDETIEGCPYEIVGIFSDKPESKAIAYAKEVGLPHYSLDLRKFHQEAGTSLSDLDTRAAFDAEVYQLIQSCEADMILLAGYVWATTEVLVDNYLVVNVHPADLSVIRNGERPYAGANGVGSTIMAGDKTICSSAHIATSAIDGGPLLMLSPDIPIDYHAFGEEAALRKHVLGLVNEHSRQLSARVLLDISEGRFGYDDKGRLCYRDAEIPKGFKIQSWEQDKPRQERDITSLVSPKSIAVIGASQKGGLGFSILHNARVSDFNGSLYAVNRNGETVDQVPGFKSILEIPGPVDLAVLALPSAGVLDVTRECGEKGVRSIVCITAGFRETGALGAQREEELKEMLDRYNMRMLGPNCMGLFNTDENVKMNTTMLKHLPDKGGISFVTQSGALGAAMLDYADTMGMGFSIIASLGNQMDVNVNDLLPVLMEDENTKVILLYLEAIEDPMRFLRIAKKVVRKKPIILLKSGKSPEGANAASSHTGSIAGSDRSLTALFEKVGIIRVDTLEQAFTVSMALSHMPQLKGNRVGVITNAGGPGILTVDSLSAYGFEIPILAKEERESLALLLLPEASTGNPIDVVAAAAPEQYAVSIRAMAESGLYDALLVVCVPPATIDTGKVAEVIKAPIHESGIPVLCNFAGPTLGKPAREILTKAGVPCVDFPEKLVETLDAMRVQKSRSADKTIPMRDMARIHKARKLISGKAEDGYLTTNVVQHLLNLYGFDLPSSCLVEGAMENIRECEDPYSGKKLGAFTYPVVSKIEHPEIIHKSDVGGVVLDIADFRQLEEVIESLLEKFPGATGVMVQEQIDKKVELILGAKSEGDMGSVMMVGAGGTGVELYKDVQLMHVPASPETMAESIAKLRCYPLLQGYRGEKGVDLVQLNTTLDLLNQMIFELPEIVELDLNPVVSYAGGDGFKVLDARIRISKR